MPSLQGLRAQFILLAFFCIAGTIGATSYHVIEREQRLLEEAASKQAMILAGSSAVLFTNAFIYEELGMLDTAGMAEYLEYYVSDVMNMDNRILSFMTLDHKGTVVSHNDLRQYGTHRKIDDFAQILNAGKILIHKSGTEKNALEVLVPLIIESKKWGMCRIVFSLHDVTEAMKTLQIEVLGIASISLILSLILIGFAAEYFIRPLRKLSNAMEQMTVLGDISQPIPALPKRRDEIGQLQQSFHWMSSRLLEEERARLQTREQLFHAEKMATLGQLTASIAHEINNPLGGIILCFNNLCSGKLDDDARKQHINVIDTSLQRMKKTMRDLLDYSRQSDLNCQAVSPKKVIEKSLDLLGSLLQQKGISLQTDYDKELPDVTVDTGKIQQAIVNLVINATQAMPDGGQLQIRIKKNIDYISMEICDTGHGIHQEIQEKIFDPFYTTKNVGEGTGLGLALSRSIVEQHGGTLRLVTSSDQGSCFALHLRYNGVKNG